MTDVIKVIELNRLRAEMLDESISPSQKKYYLELAQWLEDQNIQSAQEATESIKKTPYYDGAALAKELDGIHLRIKAAHELGYEEVEKIHKERREKLLSRGLEAYAFSQEWIDDYNRVQQATIRYMEIKEIYARIFRSYVSILISIQPKQRNQAIKDLEQALDALERKNVRFSDLVSMKAFRQLTLMSESGMNRVIQCIETLQKTKKIAHQEDATFVEKEQKRIERWAQQNARQLMAVGKQEQWNRANCIAVPSQDCMGYDFIAMKEVKG